jgi:hypothetical protein
MTVAPAQQAAVWMREQIEEHGVLYQDQAAAEITARFGDDCTYENENGNLAISREVLKHFRAVTSITVVWDSAERMWRRREKFDSEGRRADQ